MDPKAQPHDPLSEAHRFQLLVESIRDYAIYLLDPYGFVASWNAGAEAINGYTAAEIVGQPFTRFFTPEDQLGGVPRHVLQQAREKGRHESEGWRVRKDGSRFWALATLTAIHDATGRLVGFAKVTRDLTERMAAQNALVESERRFRLLVEGVTDYAIFLLDPSGIVSNWNAGAQRMKGYTADEIVGQHFSRFYTREERTAGLPARVLYTAEREGRYEAEGWRVRKDGSRFWASIVIDAIRTESGELLGYAKITRDITERRAAQEALRDSERQFRLLVRSVTDYALYMLDPNGIISNWNAGAEAIKGYTADEIVGRHFSQFYTESDRAAGLPAKGLAVAAREGRFEAEGWRVRKDGSQFWANVIIDAIRDENGVLIGYAKITRDVTEQRRAQIALQETQAQRAQVKKMDALGQLTGGVAHDFNNMLMVIGGFVQTLKKLVAHDAKGVRAAEAIELAARKGEALTRQLLTFSRRQAINPRVTDLNDRINAVSSILESSAGGSVQFISSLAPDTWRVKVDTNELELALVNLVLNARDAMPQGGVVTLTSENMRLEAVETSEKLSGDFVALTVSDVGTGIAPDVLDRVFEPFFTTKTGTGSGLGLSQVHGFAHQSGGAVTIRSELGKGTSVTLYLPRADGVPEGDAAHTPAEAFSGRVLLVEDNPEVAEVSTSLLEQLGFEVRLAGNAGVALDALAREKFDLLVSDIIMAGPMDGLNLARAVRERKLDIPILLVTGYSNAVRRAEDEFYVLRKPYGLNELTRAIATVTGRGEASASNLVRLPSRSRPPRPDEK